jgi:hypothetical protein
MFLEGCKNLPVLNEYIAKIAAVPRVINIFAIFAAVARVENVCGSRNYGNIPLRCTQPPDKQPIITIYDKNKTLC